MNFLSVLMGLMMCFTHLGCDAGQIGEPYVKEPEIKLTYELPENWRFDQESDLMARATYSAHEGAAPFVGLEVMEYPKGTEEDAKNRAYAMYEKQKQHCDQYPDCGTKPEFAERTIAGEKVYAYVDAGNYFGDESWGTDVFFEKDGRVIYLSFGGERLEYLDEVLSTIIQTAKIETVTK